MGVLLLILFTHNSVFFLKTKQKCNSFDVVILCNVSGYFRSPRGIRTDIQVPQRDNTRTIVIKNISVSGYLVIFFEIISANITQSDQGTPLHIKLSRRKTLRSNNSRMKILKFPFRWPPMKLVSY